MQTNANIVVAIINNSLEIYDGLKSKQLDKNDLFNKIKEKEDINKLELKELTTRKKNKMISICSKTEYLDELLYINEDKYSHLKDIKELVNLDNLINYILPDNIFIEKIKLYYSYLVIDILTETFYDYKDLKILSKIKENIVNVEKKLNQKILKKLDEYYVIKITV